MIDTFFNQTFNCNILTSQAVITPKELRQSLPATSQALQSVLKARRDICNILDGKDSRLIVIVGPCSIHDPKSAMEYAHKLKNLADQYQDEIVTIMRVYFEKPRTTTGWKGLINDPNLDDSFDIDQGLYLARKLLIDINSLGLACGTEALDPITPQYIAELISWSAIGARTTESQTHREIASGLSMPVGFKNGTDGNISVAINALKSVSTSHHFLGIDEEGRVTKFETRGNAYAHIVLRGGEESGPNYSPDHLEKSKQELERAGLKSNIVVDCSHANSYKDHTLQPLVLESLAQQIEKGTPQLVGVMIESNLFEGNQPITEKRTDLKYGVSLTDKCVDFASTEKMFARLAKAREQRV